MPGAGSWKVAPDGHSRKMAAGASPFFKFRRALTSPATMPCCSCAVCRRRPRRHSPRRALPKGGGAAESCVWTSSLFSERYYAPKKEESPRDSVLVSNQPITKEKAKAKSRYSSGRQNKTPTSLRVPSLLRTARAASTQQSDTDEPIAMGTSSSGGGGSNRVGAAAAGAWRRGGENPEGTPAPPPPPTSTAPTPAPPDLLAQRSADTARVMNALTAGVDTEAAFPPSPAPADAADAGHAADAADAGHAADASDAGTEDDRMDPLLRGLLEDLPEVFQLILPLLDPTDLTLLSRAGPELRAPVLASVGNVVVSIKTRLDSAYYGSSA